MTIGLSTTTATFADMKSGIADDIDDTTNEYETQIESAILSAIRYCERGQFYFNESRDITFLTVDGQQWYDASDNPDIPTLVRIVAAFSEDGNGESNELRRVTSQELETMADNTASTGEPYCYAYFGQKIRLYPIPGATVYTIRLQTGPYRLDKITAANQTNAWITEAFDMVKARAKYILAKDTLKDAVVAAEALNDYREQHDALVMETSKRKATGQIKATCF